MAALSRYSSQKLHFLQIGKIKIDAQGIRTSRSLMRTPAKGIAMAQSSPQPAPRGLSTADASAYITFSESFLRKARIGLTDTPGPEFQRIGRKIIYLREDLDAFLDQGESAAERAASSR